MAKVPNVNYQSAGNEFQKGNAAADSFAKEDVQKLAYAVDAHDHTSTLGLPVQRLTTGQLNGDTFYATAAGAISRLAIGATNQVLGVIGGIPAWIASLQSLMTTTGDLVYASSANTPARLAIGSATQVLTVTGGLPVWAAAGGLVLVGSDTTERTTTSTTNVNLSTITVNIGVATPFFVICSYRKSGGAAFPIYLGLGLNATTPVGPNAVTSATDEAESGILMFFVSAHDATYLRSGLMISMNAPSPTTTNNWFFGVDMPNATTTSVIIRATTGSALVTCAVSNVRVYTFPTS